MAVCLLISETSRPIPAFIELLANLPNLHTIQIVNGSNAEQLKKLLYGRVLPSVRSVILPYGVYSILKFCPGVREVTCNDWTGAHLVRGLTEGKCDQVEVMRGIYPDEFYIKRLSS